MVFHKYLNTLFAACLFLCIAAYASAGDISGTRIAEVDGNRVEMTLLVINP
jgi:hypothetical protein